MHLNFGRKTNKQRLSKKYRIKWLLIPLQLLAHSEKRHCHSSHSTRRPRVSQKYICPFYDIFLTFFLFCCLEYVLNEEAVSIIKQVPKPIGIISVAGAYRTGKSYLLNRMILNRRGGFGVGPTVNPCTKVIYLIMLGEKIMLLVHISPNESSSPPPKKDGKRRLCGIIMKMKDFTLQQNKVKLFNELK